MAWHRSVNVGLALVVGVLVWTAQPAALTLAPATATVAEDETSTESCERLAAVDAHLVDEIRDRVALAGAGCVVDEATGTVDDAVDRTVDGLPVAG